ncbi:MAG TPA: PadR family transcriptional regulator [Candidatus Acidoferrales bacterium]|nr:PadR family transcriptional regulator [Candidatus Acidoferrales bacterium]
MCHENKFWGHRHFGSFRGRRGFMQNFGGFVGGAGIRAARMISSGDLQLIILALLSEKPRHGYEIIKAIEEHSSGVYTPSPGVVYPALTYLEEVGYASSEPEGSKKLYRITEAGAEHLKKNNASVDEKLEQLAGFGRKVAQFRKYYAEEHEQDDEPAYEAARHIKSEWRQVKTEFRSLRGELKAALYEKLDASADERKRIIGILRRAIDEIRAK